MFSLCLFSPFLDSVKICKPVTSGLTRIYRDQRPTRKEEKSKPKKWIIYYLHQTSVSLSVKLRIILTKISPKLFNKLFKKLNIIKLRNLVGTPTWKKGHIKFTGKITSVTYKILIPWFSFKVTTKALYEPVCVIKI